METVALHYDTHHARPECEAGRLDDIRAVARFRDEQAPRATPALRALDGDKFFGADDLIAFLNEVAACGWELRMQPTREGWWSGTLAKDLDRLYAEDQSFWGSLSALRFKFARLAGLNLGPSQ